MPIETIKGKDQAGFAGNLGTGVSNDALSDELRRDQARNPYGGQSSPAGSQARNGRAFSFSLTSYLWLQTGKTLVLHAGPSEAQWSLPLRASEEEIQSGHARYASARKVGTDLSSTAYFDTPTVAFTFQTGNILPLQTGGSTRRTPYGLGDFYSFMELLNQPPLIPSGEKEGTHNYSWVFYTSLMYPDMVLKGYFSPEGVSWTDSADNPAGFSWTATLKVHESSIDLWQADTLKNTYESFTFF